MVKTDCVFVVQNPVKSNLEIEKGTECLEVTTVDTPVSHVSLS